MVLLLEFRDWELPQLRDAIDREFCFQSCITSATSPSFLRDAMGSTQGQ